MNRLFYLRRCSMSSIEEEDESIGYDELNSQRETISTSITIPQWDSELSESEQEFDDNNEHRMDNVEEQAANRALKSFLHSSSRTHDHQMVMNGSNDGYSPYSVHLNDDDDDSTALDLILTELRDIKAEFDQCPSTTLRSKPMTHHSFSSSNACVHELRTLEDQLEAALASLTLSINDRKSAEDLPPQRSSDSSACSSGVGEELINDSFHLYPTSKRLTAVDDVDSAFSESGSTDKILLPSYDDQFVSSVQNSSKILIRTYNDDGSTKSLFIDETMSIRDILFVLIHKNHREPNIDYVLIEILPELHMERIFEDHQKLAEAILMWPTISSNRLNFSRRMEKYSSFRSVTPNDEHLQTSPDIEGNIYFKEKSRKSWKKHFCVLRSSGLYFVPKGKSKKDLICLAKFENVELFFGLDWKKKFKSPTDFSFALKHPLIQKKSSKYIKYMCVETKNEFDRWIVNIRLAKFGQQLKMNYLLMDRAMNIYRASGRFVTLCKPRVEAPAIKEPPAAPINRDDHSNKSSEFDETSPIKSASYMDELRQRLERVLNDSPGPSSNSNVVRRPTVSIGSTPLPRKQLNSAGTLSYRTIKTPVCQTSSSMSKSFCIPSKREGEQRSTGVLEYKSNSSLSVTSISEEIDFPPPPSSFNLKTKPTILNRSKPSELSVVKPLISSKITPIQSHKPLPLVPPRKSSVTPACRKTHISHL